MMTSWIFMILAICIFSMFIPILTYFTVKFGTFAYFSGKRLYQNTYPEKQ